MCWYGLGALSLADLLTVVGIADLETAQRLLADNRGIARPIPAP